MSAAGQQCEQNVLPRMSRGVDVKAAETIFENILVCFSGEGTVGELLDCRVTAPPVVIGHDHHRANVEVMLGAHVTLRDCTVEGGAACIDAFDSGGGLVVHTCVLQGAAVTAVNGFEEAELEVHNCVIRDCGLNGISVEGAGTQLLATGSSVQRCKWGGVVCQSRAVVELSHMHVQDVEVAFEALSWGGMHLYDCVSEAWGAYAVDEGGEVFCKGCTPDNKLYSLAEFS